MYRKITGIRDSVLKELRVPEEYRVLDTHMDARSGTEIQ
jgi:hypothetical protein